jgi:hypothetical protein
MILEPKFFPRYLLAALFVASIPVFASAADEQESPELGSTVVYGAATAPGGKVTVAADAWDDDGVKSILLRFENDAAKTALTVTLDENDDDGLIEEYAGTLNVPKDAPEGVYRLKSAALTDELDNRSFYVREEDLIGDDDDTFVFTNTPQFTVTANDSPPSVVSFRIGRGVLPPGGSTFLAIETDEASGLDTANLIFRNPQNGRRLFFSLDEDDRLDENTYQAALQIPDFEPGGTYALYRMNLKDAVGNEQTYGGIGEDDALPLPFACKFEVVPGGGDASPPTLLSVAVTDTRTDEDGNFQYRILIGASDALSGIEHMTARFKNDENGRAVSIILAASDFDGTFYSGWLDVNRYEPAGTFSLDNVGLMDEAGNYQAYCRSENLSEGNHKLALPEPVSLIVNSGVRSADDTAPVLQSVAVTPADAQPGDALRITASAADDVSGVEKIRLKFYDAAGKSLIVTLLPDGDRFLGTIKSFQTRREGMYVLVSATVTDRAQNQRTYKDIPDESSERLLIKAYFQIKNN